jgi:hypothetical protein
MSLEKPLDSVAEADLQALIADAVPERAVIEYKSQLPGYRDQDKKEFLADVSSFANALGGHLVYGMEEMAGLPTALSGVETQDTDAEKLRLENIIGNGIAPRIPSVQIAEPIRLANGRFAFVIRVPRSWISPHMVVFQGHSKFYSRNSSGKFVLDVQQLRAAFLFSEATTDRLRDFRADRLAKIVAGATPAKLRPGPRIVLHAIPLGALERRARFDATTLRTIRNASGIQPIFSESFCNARSNFDGYLVAERFNDSSTLVPSYLQLFRAGELESVFVLAERLGTHNSKLISAIRFEKEFMDRLPSYFNALKLLGTQPPIFVALSLMGVSGYSLRLPPEAAYTNYVTEARIEDDSLIVPEVMAESFECNFDELMKPAFDAVWNAAGLENSPFYEGTTWVGLNKFLPKLR